MPAHRKIHTPAIGAKLCAGLTIKEWTPWTDVATLVFLLQREKKEKKKERKRGGKEKNESAQQVEVEPKQTKQQRSPRLSLSLSRRNESNHLTREPLDHYQSRPP